MSLDKVLLEGGQALLLTAGFKHQTRKKIFGDGLYVSPSPEHKSQPGVLISLL